MTGLMVSVMYGVYKLFGGDQAADCFAKGFFNTFILISGALATFAPILQRKFPKFAFPGGGSGPGSQNLLDYLTYSKWILYGSMGVLSQANAERSACMEKMW